MRVAILVPARGDVGFQALELNARALRRGMRVEFTFRAFDLAEIRRLFDRRRELGALVVEDLTALGEYVPEVLNNLRALLRDEIRVISLSDHMDTDDDGTRAMLGALASMLHAPAWTRAPSVSLCTASAIRAEARRATRRTATRLRASRRRPRILRRAA